MADTHISGMSRQSGVVSLAKAPVMHLLSACAVMLMAACGPAHSPDAPASTWTGDTSADPLTDATITTAVTQVRDTTGSFLADFTLTCTAAGGQAAFDAKVVFFDNQNAGAPLLVLARGGPQDLAVLRVGDLEPVRLGLHNLSAQYSNELVVLGGRTGAQGSGDLQRYAMLAQLPDADRLVLKPTLTTGEPIFTVSLADAPAVHEVFASCTSVFQRYDELAREAQADSQVRQEQAELYARPPASTEDQAPIPPRREDFEQHAAQAETDCLRRYSVTEDPSDNATRRMCAEARNGWRQDFVNAAAAYAVSVRTRHYNEFGQHRWAAEGRAAAACGRQYEAASRAASTSDAADAAAQTAVDCYLAAGNPPPEP
jgi:hypothetical protein